LELTPKTRLSDLLDEFPFLLNYLADYKPEWISRSKESV
jgi:hypothetical protein